MKIVVAGAGPVGALTAILLAEQGHDVQVYEKRKLPERKPGQDNAQAYLLNLNAKSLQTLREHSISLKELLDACGSSVDITFFRPDGSVRHRISTPVDPKNPLMVRVFRDEIARHLIDESQRLYPDQIIFHWEDGIASANFSKQIATTSSGKEVKYDLLVGADGANSQVRASLSKELPPDFITRKGHTAVYRTGPLNAPKGTFPSHAVMEMHAFSRGAIMVYGRGEGDFRVAVFCTEPDVERFKQGKTQFMIDEMKLPGINPHAKKAAVDIIKGSTTFNHISGWTYLSQLYGPKTLLLGDAAHTMTPILGQGCNSGLEDANLFAKSLKKHPDNLEQALKHFNAARLPDIHALLKLNEVAANERHLIMSSGSIALSRLWIQSHALMMVIHNGFEGFLHRKFPFAFSRPVMIRSQLGQEPYRKVFPAMYRDTAIVTSLGLLTLAGLYSAASHAYTRLTR